MIRALLDGRKSQTRRVLKPQPSAHHWRHFKSYALDPMEIDTSKGLAVRFMHSFAEPRAENTQLEDAVLLPYQIGDLLWCRETWCEDRRGHTLHGGLYRATSPEVETIDDGDGHAVLNKDGTPKSPWRSPLHMPRWASRLTLEVTSVKVERLQDISEADAEAEGIFRITNGLWSWEPGNKASAGYHSVRGAFDALWTGINGPTAWTENPFVVALSFSVHKTNVDALLKQREAA